MDKEDENEEPTDREVVLKALDNARKAYLKTFEDNSLESGFFPINITVFFLDESYEDILEMFKDMEFVPKADR